jgi:hypothetical protein
MLLRFESTKNRAFDSDSKRPSRSSLEELVHGGVTETGGGDLLGGYPPFD